MSSSNLPEDQQLLFQDLKHIAEQLANANYHLEAAWFYTRAAVYEEKAYKEAASWSRYAQAANELEISGKFAEANEFYEKDAAFLLERINNDKDRLTYVGETHHIIQNELVLGRLNRCRDYLSSAMKICKSMQSNYKQQMEYAFLLCDSALIARDEGRFSDASKEFILAADISESITGANLMAAANYLQVAELYAKSQDTTNAVKYVNMAQQQADKANSSGWLNVVDVNDRLAVAYLSLNNLSKALSCCRTAVETFANRSSDELRNKMGAYRSCLSTLRHLLAAIKTPAEAESVKSTLAEVQNTLPSRGSQSAPLDIILACYMASIDRIEKNPQEAERLHKEILDRCKKISLDDLDLCLGCLQYELGQDALSLNKPEEARKHFEQSAGLKTLQDDFYYSDAHNQLVSLEARKK